MKAFIRFKALIAVTALAGLTALLLAEPAWWVQRGVRDPNKDPSDYAVLNQGQLKNLARAARDEMNAKMPGGAGEVVETLITSWSTSTADTKDYAAVNVGQLKALAKPFYDRLLEAGVVAGYPWSAETTDDADYAVANIGQAKAVFGFEVFVDTDGDGIDDHWEMFQFGTLDRTNELDADGDGVLDLDEYGNGTLATQWDSDNDGLGDATESAANATLLVSANLRLFQRVE